MTVWGWVIAAIVIGGVVALRYWSVSAMENWFAKRAERELWKREGKDPPSTSA